MGSNFINSAEKDSYLFCDGSTFSSSKYPKLYKVLGTTTLPDLRTRFLEGSSTAGTYKDAGIPNIKGHVGGGESFNSAGTYIHTGPFYLGSTNVIVGNSPNDIFDCDIIEFDASRVSSVYKNNVTTVQSASYTVRYYIRAK